MRKVELDLKFRHRQARRWPRLLLRVLRDKERQIASQGFELLCPEHTLTLLAKCRNGHIPWIPLLFVLVWPKCADTLSPKNEEFRLHFEALSLEGKRGRDISFIKVVKSYEIRGFQILTSKRHMFGC